MPLWHSARLSASELGWRYCRGPILSSGRRSEREKKGARRGERTAKGTREIGPKVRSSSRLQIHSPSRWHTLARPARLPWQDSAPGARRIGLALRGGDHSLDPPLYSPLVKREIAVMSNPRKKARENSPAPANISVGAQSHSNSSSSPVTRKRLRGSTTWRHKKSLTPFAARLALTGASIPKPPDAPRYWSCWCRLVKDSR